MHARLALEVERLLHLFEGGRNPGFLQPGLDEADQFVLLRGQHGARLLKFGSDPIPMQVVNE